MSSTIIIGNGPAGVSAALYTARAGIETTIVGKDFGALEKAASIENYYGFSSPISGKDLITDGLAGAKRLGVSILQDEVIGISFTNSFSVTTKYKNLNADSVILATGTSRRAPVIQGLKQFEGRGVSYCAVCDAFFYRKKSVAVLGSGAYALHEAMELLPVTSSVTLLTNGVPLTVDVPDEIMVNTQKIKALEGGNQLESILFEDESTLDVYGLFIAFAFAQSTDLARKLGALTEKNKILVDSKMSTNLPGLYAAGDCTGGLLQISKAVYEGAKAGTEVIQYLRNLEKSKIA